MHINSKTFKTICEFGLRVIQVSRNQESISIRNYCLLLLQTNMKSWAEQSHTWDFLWDFLCIFHGKYESLFLHIELGLDELVFEIPTYQFLWSSSILHIYLLHIFTTEGNIKQPYLICSQGFVFVSMVPLWDWQQRVLTLFHFLSFYGSISLCFWPRVGNSKQLVLSSAKLRSSCA